MSAARNAIERVNILGVGVSAINMDQAVRTIAAWLRAGEPSYVCVTGVHGIMESHRDAAIRDIHNRAGLVTPDGMPLVWLLKAAGHRHADRVYGPDLMLEVFGRCADARHFLYGSSAGTLARLRRNLGQAFPQARIVGAHAPPFRLLTPEEDAEVVDRINRSGADIVWVGLSTPKQERWMAAHRARLRAAVLIGVGAAFDFHAGRVRQAPRVMQRAGLEWLFRLAMEPRRLWKRYLRNNPAFVWRVLAQQVGLRRYRTGG